MNAGLENSHHPSIQYYDGDYPSKEDNRYPENFDDTVPAQGLAYDIDNYKELVSKYGSSVLELCCGTGRVAIPLAKAGHRVTAVDFSKELLNQFKDKLKGLEQPVVDRLTIVEQDVTALSLDKKDFDVILCPFNSLLCIPDFDMQQQVLTRAYQHLRDGGLFILDLMNPFNLNTAGDSVHKLFFSRINPTTGNRYMRFAALGPMQVDQKQKLHGWYDEMDKAGKITRQPYEMYWRPIYRYEIQLMLEKAGFKIDTIQGSHKGDLFTTSSRKMIVHAVK